MRIVLLSVFLLFLQRNLYSQNSIAVEFADPSLFKGKGLIFGEDYSPKIQLPKNAKVINATTKQAYIAELIFLNKFSKNTKLLYYNNKNIKRCFFHYNRQYLGYQDQEGDVNIIINLLNFRNRRTAKEKFKNWEKYYFIGFGQFYEKNTLRVRVNIDLCEVDLW